MKKNIKVLVTGSSGFLGSHIVDHLSSEGYYVIGLDFQKASYKQALSKFHCCDILDYKSVNEALIGCDYVYHLAGVADIDESVEDPEKTIKGNIIGTQNILKASLSHKVKRIIFASTIYVYSDLGGFYRATKQACEKIIEEYQKAYGLNYTILRYGSLYGIRSNSFNSIRNMLNQALKKKEIIRRGDGEEIREYINVKDAAKLSVKVLNKEFANRHLILTGNQSMKIRELLSMIREIFKDKIKITYKLGDELHHYQITPFSFQSQIAERLTPNSFIDIGQGLLEVLNELHHEKFVRNNDDKISLRDRDK